MGMKTLPLKPRFESKFSVTPGCWIWNAGLTEDGYGVFVAKRKNWMAHRFSYEFYVEPIPKGLFVCHRCDNPLCVNPDHLFLGTPLDNMLDKTAKGRNLSPKGVRHGSNKLSEDQVRAIRQDGRFLKDISRDYGVSIANISSIKKRTIWSHI